MKGYIWSVIQFCFGVLLISGGLFAIDVSIGQFNAEYICGVVAVIFGIILVVRSYVYRTIYVISTTENPIRQRLEELASTVDASIRTTIFFSTDQKGVGVLENQPVSIESGGSDDELMKHFIANLTEGDIRVRASSNRLRSQLKGYTLAIVDAREGSRIVSHSHNVLQSTYFVSGKAKVWIDGEAQIYEANSNIRIPPFAVHSVKFLRDTTFVVLYDSGQLSL